MQVDSDVTDDRVARHGPCDPPGNRARPIHLSRLGLHDVPSQSLHQAPPTNSAPSAQDAQPATKDGAPGTKADDLAPDTESSVDAFLTTNHGVRINDDQNTLKAGTRGPSLLEDFHFREKMTHFDHERIPERVVHARGAGAHGIFRVYEPMEELSKAAFLRDPSKETPVFVRFSTVVGSRGSADLARDVRGFAVKFYTDEGNFDLVGNNMPVFFIQDAIKFPDLVHAIKPEPHREIPQASAAHDTFWDFISVTPESMHTIMWVMSDRALPRSYRMMEGFGVHTFRMVATDGTSRFVKFHWKPLLGVHSVLWNEAQKVMGFDPDFHRRDLWDAIDQGHFPEWELGVQVVEEADEFSFDFDLLDPTKLIPEELVPVQRIGRMTLNRNPDNFFAETEQVAFHIGHVVPGIDFTDDPLLQGRLFSYTDTQLLRLGGPNFHEIPINRPLAPVHNNQRDGLMRQTINQGKVSYGPNTMASGCPFQAGMAEGGFTSVPVPTTGVKVRERSPSFFDHFSQARMFFLSQSAPEQLHMIKALRFELGKVELMPIRERMLFALAQVDVTMAGEVAKGLGIPIPDTIDPPLNQQVPADGDTEAHQSTAANPESALSPALSMLHAPVVGVSTRQIAVLLADGFDSADLMAARGAITGAGASIKTVAPHLGVVVAADGSEVLADFSFLTTASVLHDAVLVVGGEASVDRLLLEPDALHFVREAFKHCKAIGAMGEAERLLAQAGIASEGDAGIVSGDSSPARHEEFVAAVAVHRHWVREMDDVMPA